MLRMIAAASVFLSVLCGSAQAADRPLNQPPEGFTNLFNGKDLTGWRGRKQDYSPYEEAKLSKDEQAAKQEEWNADLAQHWSVDADKGEIVSDGHGVYLTTDKDYGDFEFYVDWLMVSHNGDSGIYLRGYPAGADLGPGEPQGSEERRPQGLRRALERQRRQPRQVAAGEGRQPGRPVEHLPHQDDRLARLGLAQRQADRRRPDPRQLSSTARKPSSPAARSSCRPTARRSASATSTSARSPVDEANDALDKLAGEGLQEHLQRQGLHRLGRAGRRVRGEGRRDRLQARQGRHDSHRRGVRRLRGQGRVQAPARPATTAWPSATPARATPPTSACASCRSSTTPPRSTKSSTPANTAARSTASSPPSAATCGRWASGTSSTSPSRATRSRSS